MSSQAKYHEGERPLFVARPLFTWKRFDDKVHDLSTTIERCPPESSPLSQLPVELREQIYSYIFHDHINNQYCKDFHLGLGNLGCRCGKGLSRSNYLLYNETRQRYYRCARFVFTTPEACKRFLGIGRITKFMGNLSIAYREEYAQSSLLRPIFNDLVFSSCLQSLHIRIKMDEQSLGRRPPPIYLSKLDCTLKAELYDLSLRPVRHPLADLKCVRHLVVQGQPGIEIEEAIFQLICKIENLARKEGKTLRTKAQWRPAFGEWFYEVKIIE